MKFISIKYLSLFFLSILFVHSSYKRYYIKCHDIYISNVLISNSSFIFNKNIYLYNILVNDDEINISPFLNIWEDFLYRNESLQSEPFYEENTLEYVNNISQDLERDELYLKKYYIHINNKKINFYDIPYTLSLEQHNENKNITITIFYEYIKTYTINIIRENNHINHNFSSYFYLDNIQLFNEETKEYIPLNTKFKYNNHFYYTSVNEKVHTILVKGLCYNSQMYVKENEIYDKFLFLLNQKIYSNVLIIECRHYEYYDQSAIVHKKTTSHLLNNFLKKKLKSKIIYNNNNNNEEEAEEKDGNNKTMKSKKGIYEYIQDVKGKYQKYLYPYKEDNGQHKVQRDNTKNTSNDNIYISTHNNTNHKNNNNNNINSNSNSNSSSSSSSNSNYDLYKNIYTFETNLYKNNENNSTHFNDNNVTNKYKDNMIYPNISNKNTSNNEIFKVKKIYRIFYFINIFYNLNIEITKYLYNIIEGNTCILNYTKNKKNDIIINEYICNNFQNYISSFYFDINNKLFAFIKVDKQKNIQRLVHNFLETSFNFSSNIYLYLQSFHDQKIIKINFKTNKSSILFYTKCIVILLVLCSIFIFIYNFSSN
ncbi:hypothetical protein PFMC_00925 [Plasmodium falciparum CAMP/Malaysia]|uniref:Uncharacterized protein n=1 Tax=Plasmodium falciparum (isolate Camp / Malaysia) TaxID=5835 RepID=A0A024XBX1_PLAFC|nr:hypothetical protein PFMC_00925 [Plasmodium falciparum CAMP/Malaysia]